MDALLPEEIPVSQVDKGRLMRKTFAQVMEARFVMRDSTIMFCCIMFNAMLVVVK